MCTSAHVVHGAFLCILRTEKDSVLTFHSVETGSLVLPAVYSGLAGSGTAAADSPVSISHFTHYSSAGITEACPRFCRFWESKLRCSGSCGKCFIYAVSHLPTLSPLLKFWLKKIKDLKKKTTMKKKLKADALTKGKFYYMSCFQFA